MANQVSVDLTSNGNVDIDKAIVAGQEAVDLTPNGHADKAGHLNNLGAAFWSWFNQLRDLADIDKAIAANQEAVHLTSEGHAKKATRLANLGNAFYSQFNFLGDLTDLERSIEAKQEAVDLTPDGHADRARWLNNLGNSLQAQFEQLGDVADIDKAISANQKAVHITSDCHAQKAQWLSSLGNAFLARFKQLGNLTDIDKAIVTGQEAVHLIPNGHARKAEWLTNLGIAFQSQFEQVSDLTGIGQGHQGSTSTLQAYRAVLEIIPQVVWLGHKITRRYQELSNLGSVINAAVATAISDGELTLALEWLEEGRSIVWNQILQLRTPVADLQVQNSVLADRLITVTQALENAGSSPSMYDYQNFKEKDSSSSAEHEAQAHHALAAEYKKLINQLRKLKGFESFLEPKKLSQLIPSSIQGPVIMINVHTSQCDALDKADHLYSQMSSILKMHNIRSPHRKLMLAESDSEDSVGDLQLILTNLWSWVVKPVWIALKSLLMVNKPIGCLPHITWCPTGQLAFLPLHAAGIYGSSDSHGAMNIAELVVSSYTPTLTTLLNPAVAHTELVLSQRMLIISQAKTPHQPQLLGTIKEAKLVQNKMGIENCTYLEGDKATISANSEEPLKSSFVLADGNLNLETLMKMSVKKAELAFLSACQTATGDARLPEESVHLAVGMLAAGFPNVIGTMWSIMGQDAPVVTEAFYSRLVGESKISEPKGSEGRLQVAYALHDAVQKLREKVGVKNFERWVPFIHFGL
ncbi:hypothetical protein M422DRAFT_259234 [Sphaerobolus stellatus SS14]|uniref:CHAT domain-containing protein n=1 Tax=Sphaerobolus stellatus (strain SS14) TaxID=990650 RepID=A0A0C9VKQ3_SPHS4|nr:hypothetical protein M422DRAFT_259234 [Sphaerobolus stellatus SS14]